MAICTERRLLSHSSHSVVFQRILGMQNLRTVNDIIIHMEYRLQMCRVCIENASMCRVCIECVHRFIWHSIFQMMTISVVSFKDFETSYGNNQSTIHETPSPKPRATRNKKKNTKRQKSIQFNYRAERKSKCMRYGRIDYQKSFFANRKIVLKITDEPQSLNSHGWPLRCHNSVSVSFGFIRLPFQFRFCVCVSGEFVLFFSFFAVVCLSSC